LIGGILVAVKLAILACGSGAVALDTDASLDMPESPGSVAGFSAHAGMIKESGRGVKWEREWFRNGSIMVPKLRHNYTA